MADSGQRLLDVIDDPNALESFLGGLAADTTVDNAVESLARSLAAEFEVDSPSETLFEPLESSNNLTDLSQSNVPFDFSSANELNAYASNDPSDQFQHGSQDMGGGGTYTQDQNTYQDFSQPSDDPQTPFTTQPSSLSSLPDPTTPTSTNLISSPSIQQHSTATATPPVSTSVYTTSDQTTQQQQQQQQYAASYTQLVQAQQQTQQIQQLITTSSAAGGLGQTGFIIDSNGQPMMVSTGGNGFGANLALVAAGVQPTYAVLPASTPLFMQQPTIQSIKNSNGTTSYFHTTQGTPIITQGVNTATSVQNVRPKQPPHLLPKPAGKGGQSPAQGTVMEVSSTSSVVQTTQTSSAGGTITMTTANMESLTQMIQQQQQQQSSGGGGMSIGQPSYAIGAGGQVVQVSAVQTLNTMTGPQAIVLNQFGQQMIVPTAAMGQGGVQFILRQQPTQPQVLTIQAPATATTLGAQTATVNGKPMVRFMSQMPQVTQNQQIQLQQIQTANGPTWVAVRYPSVTASAPATQAQPTVAVPVAPPPLAVQTPPAQPAPVTPVSTPAVRPPTPQTPKTPKAKKSKATPKSTPTHAPVSTPAAILQFTPVTTDTISACIQSVIARLRSPSPVETQTVQSNQYSVTTPSVVDNCTPPPKKKSKPSKKKKVTLDLEQLLKQSGIMDEDLQDDGSFADFFSSPMPEETPVPPPPQPPPPVIHENGIHKTVNHNNNNNNYKPNGTPPLAYHVLKPSSKTKQKTPHIPKDPSTTPKKPPKSKAKKKEPEEVPSQPEPPTPPPKPPPKSKSKKKPPLVPPPIEAQTNNTITTNSNFVTPPKKAPKKKKPPPTPSVPVPPPTPPVNAEPVPVPVTPSPIPEQSMAPTPQNPPTRIVQTIQLTPQNQQLLRNIQAQIQRLLSLVKRNDTEQTALQKLIVLQQQVIATGTPVPNPAHLQTLSGTHGAVTLAPGTNVGVTVLKGPIPTTTSVTTSTKASPQHTTSSIEAQFQAQTKKLNSCATSPANNNAPSSNPTTPPNTIQPPPLVSNVTPTASSSNLCNGTSSTSISQSEPEFRSDLPESSTPTPVDKVTSSSTTVTTTTSSMSGYNGAPFYHSPQQHAQALLEEKRLEEQLIARLKAEEEKRIQWRKEEFESRLAIDHKKFLDPDYETPFESEDDVVERLMHYHIARDRNEMSFTDFDEDFASTSLHLLEKFGGMVSKYRSLLLKESMKEVGCAERVMLERIFVGEEKVKLEHDKQLVAQGEILDLAPPPPSWMGRIRELVDADMKEMERDSIVNHQVQCAIDSIITFGNNESSAYAAEEGEKIEYDAFGVPISSSNYNNSSSSADIDEAVRSIMI